MNDEQIEQIVKAINGLRSDLGNIMFVLFMIFIALQFHTCLGINL